MEMLKPIHVWIRQKCNDNSWYVRTASKIEEFKVALQDWKDQKMTNGVFFDIASKYLPYPCNPDAAQKRNVLTKLAFPNKPEQKKTYSAPAGKSMGTEISAKPVKKTRTEKTEKPAKRKEPIYEAEADDE